MAKQPDPEPVASSEQRPLERAGRLPGLRFREIENIKSLEATDHDLLWSALGSIASSLDDHLVIVDETSLGIDQPCRLRVFTARDPDQTELYVVVTHAGEVIVGRCDRLDGCCTRYLKNFEPLWHEVTSVAVTDRGRHVGDRLDLWIGVRRSPQDPDSDPEAVAYHGLIWLHEDGVPRLEPARDDQEVGDGDWLPGAADRLPMWFSSWDVTTMPNPDLYTELPATARAAIRAAQERTGLDLAAVAWESQVVCYSIGEEIELIGLDGDSASLSMPLPERGTALALTRSAQGLTDGVVALDAQRLMAFTVEGDVPRELWQQNRHDFPTALAFLPRRPAQNGCPREWPDLLVTYADGRIERLRRVGNRRIREVWQHCWKVLGLDRADARIAAAVEASERRREERRAALLGVVEQVLKEANKAAPGVREGWIAKVTGLFRPDESSGVVRPAVDYLLRALERFAAGQDETEARLPGQRSGDLRPALLYALYRRKLPVVIREHVDRSVRAIAWSEAARRDPNVESLRGHSYRGRDVIWHGPPPVTEREKIERAAFGLERWVSTYVQLDTSRLPKPLRYRPPSAVAGIEATGGTSEHYLALADQDKVRLLAVTGGRLTLEERLSGRVSGDVICELDPYPLNGRHGLLALGRAGLLYLLKAKGESLKQVARLDLRAYGRAWAMASCPGEDGARMVAVILGRERRTILALCRVDGRELRLLRHEPLDLPWARAVDICALGQSRYQLIVGANQAAPVRFYCLHLNRGIEHRHWFRTLRSGTLAVRFSAPESPKYAVAGERNGLVWCADLEADFGIEDLCWIHQRPSAVRRLEAVTVDGEPHFLVGCENGKLTLLRAADGRQRWNAEFRAPVRHVVKIGSQGSLVAVLMRDGWIDAFGQLGARERGEALQAMRDYLAQLRSVSRSNPDEVWRFRDAEPLRAFEELEKSSGLLVTLFERFGSPQTRARILQFLAESGDPPPGDGSEVIPKLTCRDLRLFLSYLPDGENGWIPLIRDELFRRELGKGAPGDSERGGGAAVITYLQRVGRARPDTREVRELWPGDGFLEEPWFQLEYARLLVQAAERERKEKTQAGEPAALLPILLSALFRLPPPLVGSTVRVVAYDSPAANELDAVRQLLVALADPSGSLSGQVEEVAGRLRPSETDPDWLHLLGNVLELHRQIDRHRGEPWDRWRRQALDALGGVAARSHAFTPRPGNEVTALRSFLDPRPMPDDHDPITERIQWVEHAWRLLDRPRLPHEAGKDQPWDAVISRLIELTRDAVHTLWTHEHEYLMQLVRPRLSLVSARPDEHNHLRLRLRADAEGERHLNDVSILFDAGGERGLRSPGEVEARIDQLVYPGRLPRHEIEIDGYLPPGQSTVTVRVTVTDGDAYRFEEAWPIAIPAPISRTAGRLSLPHALPGAYQRFCETAFQCREPVALAVLDQQLGRDAFLADWQARFPGRVVDLDAALREYGTGRRYVKQALDLPLINEAIDRAVTACPGGRTSHEPFLVGPTGETIQRLLDGGGEQVLRSWLASSDRQGEKEARPPLLVLVSSLHACRLRAIGLGPVIELAPHRLAAVEESDPSDTAAEAAALIAKEASLSREAAGRRFAELGGDLRFVLRWLQWLKEDPGRTTTTIRPFLEEDHIADDLRAELASLPAFDLACALAGSEAETALDTLRVFPGYVSAGEHRSTPRTSAAERLVESGEAFTRVILDRILSDRNPPPQLRIQGLGNVGTAEAPRSNLLGLVNSRRWKEREAAFRRLAERGIGTFHQEIFRTGSPYRELIRRFYARRSGTPLKLRDGEVYAALLGKGRSPAEVVNPKDVADMPADDLRRLMPGARKEDLRALRRLVQFWLPLDRDYLEGVVGALFRPERVRCLEPDASRWDQPLTSIALPVFGVRELPGLTDGAMDPETYVVWVGKPTAEVVEIVSRAAQEATGRRQHMERETEATEIRERRTPRVLILGPGAEHLPADPDRRVAILRLADAFHAAWDGNLGHGLRRKARAQLRLTAFSPFQTTGALEPGSRLFVGREEELGFITSRIRRNSIMIVGGRRMGKTSLLNRVYYWARSEVDLQPIAVDLQGVKRRNEFLEAVAEVADESDLAETLKVALRARRHARGYLRAVARAAREEGLLPIFLLNEVDGVVENDPEVVELWRSLHEDGLARFLMVGYSVIGKLGTPDSPVFHFTEGNRFGGKAMAPTALSPQAAEKLLDQLTESELDLRWRSEVERKEAHAQLLERSYRIPWVLQRYGQLLVERLEAERREEITLADVEQVLAREGNVVWQYIDGIDYQSLGYQGASAARRPGFQLVLFALARKYYFLGGPRAPIADRKLGERSALDEDLGFTVGEARDAVKETVAELLVEKEQAILSWFDRLDLGQALRLLTLTLTLEPDPGQNDRYGFLLHILPMELYRLHGKTDPTLDTLIVNTTIELLRLLDLQTKE